MFVQVGFALSVVAFYKLFCEKSFVNMKAKSSGVISRIIGAKDNTVVGATGSENFDSVGYNK